MLTRFMKRLWWIVGAVVVVGAIVIVAILLAPKYPFAPSIRSKVTSTVFVPTGRGVVIERETAKYDSGLKLLTYNIQTAGTKMVVSEQPTPESFIDIPQVYDKVITGLNEYSKFDSEQGTVHLTRPKELQGKQSAVLNAKGTLMFIKPNRDLSLDQWRQLFSDLKTVN